MCVVYVCERETHTERETERETDRERDYTRNLSFAIRGKKACPASPYKCTTRRSCLANLRAWLGAGSGTGLVVAMSGLENKALFRREGGEEREREEACGCVETKGEKGNKRVSE